MLCHASVNAVGGGYLFTFVTGPEKTILWWVYAMLWAVVAVTALALVTRGQLGDPGGHVVAGAESELVAALTPA